MIELAEAGITEMRPSGTPNGWNAVYADKTERTFESWPQVELRPASNAKYRDNFVVDMLVNLDFVTRAQVDQAEADPASEALGVLGVLLHQELVTSEQARRAFAEHFGCKFITLGDREIASEIIAMVRPDLAKGIRLVPVSFDNGVLTVAVADPSDLDLMETLRHCTPRNSGVTDFAFAVVTQEDLDLAIDKYYL